MRRRTFLSWLLGTGAQAAPRAAWLQSLTPNTRAGAVTITTKSLPPATVGVPYHAMLEASGGTPTAISHPAAKVLYSVYTWSATGLPAWLRLASRTGSLSGIPEASGSVTLTATATDSLRASSAATALALTVNPHVAPTITVATKSLPLATVGFPYRVTLTQTGAAHPTVCRWAATGLPAWLQLDPQTGVLHGKPTATGSFTIGVHVTAPGVSPVVQLTGTIGSGVDFYLSPTGDDTRGNGLTPATAWSFTALTRHAAALAGKRIGLLPGTYRGGTDNGVFTSFYAMVQKVSGNVLFTLPAGTADSYTTLASVDARGNYSPRTAIIDGSEPDATCTFVGTIAPGTAVAQFNTGCKLTVTSVTRGSLDWPSFLNLPDGTPAWIMSQLARPGASGTGTYVVGPRTDLNVSSTTLSAFRVATLGSNFAFMGFSTSPQRDVCLNVIGLTLQHFSAHGMRFTYASFVNVLDCEFRYGYVDNGSSNTACLSGSFVDNFNVVNNKFHDAVSQPPCNVTLAAAPTGKITQVTLARPWPFAPPAAGTKTVPYQAATSTGQQFYLSIPYRSTVGTVVASGSAGAAASAVTITGSPNDQLTVKVSSWAPWYTCGYLQIPGGQHSVCTYQNNTMFHCMYGMMKDYGDNCLQSSYNYHESAFMGSGPGFTLNGVSSPGSQSYYRIQGCSPVQYQAHHHNINIGVLGMDNIGFGDWMNKGIIDYYNNTNYHCATNIFPGAPSGAFKIYNNIMDGSLTFWYNFSGTGVSPPLRPPEDWPRPDSLIDYNGYVQTATFGFARYPGLDSTPPGYKPVPFSRWQTPGSAASPPCPPDFPGFDRHSITYATPTAPYLTPPQSLNINSFKVNPASPLAHAGVGRAMCGALDGSGAIGCDF